MRLSEDKIKTGILHPDRDVRDAAAMYFSKSWCRDPSILPFVIQAIEKYGWSDAFLVPSAVEVLPLSEDTLPWVLQQVQRDDLPESFRTKDLVPGWRWALASLLLGADAELLARHKSEILGIKGFENDDLDVIQTRIDLLTVDEATCWRELESLCVQAGEKHADPDTSYGYALVEAIARHGDSDRALSALAKQIEDLDDYGEGWMELFMVNLAGIMRLDAAVPYIITKLRECPKEADLLFEEGERALVKIGPDAAVEGAAALFAQGNWIRRLNGCHVLQHVHSDLAVAKTLELLPREQDSTVRAYLAQVLMSQFAYEGVEPVRQLILDGNYDTSFTDLRLDLIVAATLMDVKLAEEEQWRIEIEKDRQEREKKIRFQSEPPTDEPDYEDEDYEEEEPPPPKEKIGRNAPCPCGSGKKFKKCCMRKQQGGMDLYD